MFRSIGGCTLLEYPTRSGAFRRDPRPGGFLLAAPPNQANTCAGEESGKDDEWRSSGNGT